MIFLKNNIWWIIFGTLIFCGAIYLGSKERAQDVGQGISYETAQARIGDIELIVSGVGQVQASQQVELKAVAAGEAIDVTQVHVTNNQEVAKGQLLVSLDSREASRRVYDAQLALQSAQIKQKQIEDDYDNKTADDSRQRQLQDIAVKEKANALAQTNESLADYQIRAPFDGVITDLVVSSGDSITRTDVIASVITDGNIVVVNLNEVDALNVVAGSRATLTFDALLGVELSGEVSRIDTIGIAQQGVVGYDVEIDFDTKQESVGDLERLRPGMSVNAEITAQSTEGVLIVPNSAIKGFGDEAYVEQLTGDGDEVTRTTVSTGISNNFHTHILNGLRAGDSVITNTVVVTGEDDEQGGVSLFGNTRGFGGGGGPR